MTDNQKYVNLESLRVGKIQKNVVDPDNTR